MSSASPAPQGFRLTRRAALLSATLAGGGLAGCTSETGRPRPGRRATKEPEADPDVVVAVAALGDQREMADLLRATQLRHPDLSDLLGSALLVHRAHARLLVEAAPADEPGSSAPPSAQPSRPVVPRGRRRALAQVVAAERRLTTATRQHALKARSGAFARVLASMVAAAAQQATVIAGADVGRGPS